MNSETQKKAKDETSIATVVSFDGSSSDALKIVMLRTDGSEVTATTLASITKDGMSYIRGHGLRQMLNSSGLLEIVEEMESGNESVT